MRPHATLNFPTVLLAAIALCTCYTVFQFYACMAAGKCEFAEDFSPFYTAGRQAALGHGATPYAIEQFRDWLQSYHAANFHPFLYPPHSLLLLYWIGLLPPAAALVTWYGVHILLLFFSLRTHYARQFYEGKPLAAAMIFFPFVVLNILAGQMGIFWTALFILFLAWREARPATAGVVLAVFSFKPQLGILLPLLLLLERNWRALACAAATAAVMVAVSAWVWGMHQWQDYLTNGRLFWHVFVYHVPEKYFTVAASPYMAFRMLGCNDHIAFGLQVGLTLGILTKLRKIYTPSLPPYLLLWLLGTTTLLIIPYSYSYDTILLALPMLAIHCRLGEGRETSLERLTLICVMFIPIVSVKLQHFHIPYSFMALTFAFAAAIHTCRQTEDTPKTAEAL
jgi:hypothetical protein